jgi:hypothetical protein
VIEEIGSGRGCTFHKGDYTAEKHNEASNLAPLSMTQQAWSARFHLSDCTLS